MKDGGILMSKKNQFEFQIINEFVKGKLTRKEAALLLQVSVRTISRKALRIQKEGLFGVLHKNIGRSPSNKTDEDFREEVMNLVQDKYFDYNMVHCLETLDEIHGIKIGYDTFRRWCHKEQIVKHKHKRRKKIRKHRERMPSEGLLLQMDGSHHRWFGGKETVLIAAIDDATSDIPYAEFFNSEDTINCMVVMQKIIELKGIPTAIYVDRAGWFGGSKRQLFCQFKRACEELGIRIIFANSAQAKGRIERAWKTFQDRIIPEMRTRNIRSMPAANNYLQEQFLPNYWKLKCTVIAKSLENKYVVVPNSVDLNEIFCIKDYRTVNSNHTISWNNKIFKVISPIRYSIYKQKVEIRTYQDLTWKVYFAGKEIEIIYVENNNLTKMAA